MSSPREPRRQAEGRQQNRFGSAPRTRSDLCPHARRAAPAVVGATGKPRNAAGAPLLANPSGAGRFPLTRRCRLLIGCRPNYVGSASIEGKSAALAATWPAHTSSREMLA